MKKRYFIILLCMIPVITLYAQWQSKLVSMSTNGDLTYTKDDDGFVIPDFSNAGYKNGLPIPVVDIPECTVTISPLTDAAADNTQHIQDAIDLVGSYELNANGIRGVVKLNPGKYLVNGTINLKYDGVILRGSGNGTSTTTSTILYCSNAIGQSRNMILMGSSSDNRWGNGSGDDKTSIVNEKVMPGDYSFEVEDASAYRVGDNICVKYPTTEEWLKAVNYGGNTDSDKLWKASSIDMSYHRYVKQISGNTITLDAPVFYCLDKKYSQAYIYKIPAGDQNDKILHNVGIENLRMEFARTPYNTTGTFEQNCILMCSLENSWAKGLYLTGFVHAGIKTFSVTRSTIEDCQSIRASGERTGGNQYNFDNYYRSQLILFKNCKAKQGRHHYISNGCATVSGIVVLNMVSIDDGVDGIAEGHRLWSQGILFDNWLETTENGNKVYNRYKLGMYLRKNEGSGHGYGGTNSVFWNCDVDEGGIYLDKMPTGQNYAIGCTALLLKKHSNAATTGYIEGKNNKGLEPASLYQAQLAFRLKNEGGNTAIETSKDNSVNNGVTITFLNNQIKMSSVASGVFTLYTIGGVRIAAIQVNAGESKTIEKPGDGTQYHIVTFENNDIKYQKLIK